MTRLKILSILVGFVLVSNQGVAQFSVSKVTPQEAVTKLKIDTIRSISAVSNSFFNEAKYQAERRRIRKERNDLTCTFGLNLNQTKFENWAPGGTSSFSGVASIWLQHVYRRNKLSITTLFDSKYGLVVVKDKPFKNTDYFTINSNVAWNISKNWAYSANINLRSQWTKGYPSADNKTIISNIFSPGTFVLGIGFNYSALKKVPLRITLSPLSPTWTFVVSDTLSKMGYHGGIPPGKHSKVTLGSSIRLDLNQPIAKGKLNYNMYVLFTSNYEQNNYVDWQNNLAVTITKIIKASIYWKMIYNEPQATPQNRPLQWNYTFGLEISYTIRNK